MSVPPGGSAPAGDYGSPEGVWLVNIVELPGSEYATYCPPASALAGGSPPEVPPIRIHLTYGCIG